MKPIMQSNETKGPAPRTSLVPIFDINDPPIKSRILDNWKLKILIRTVHF
jgi:hypothetical protein